MSGNGRKAIPNVWEWLGAPPGCPGAVGRPFKLSRSGGLPNTPGHPTGPVGCPEVLGRPSRLSVRPSQMSESVREVLSVVWE